MVVEGSTSYPSPPELCSGGAGREWGSTLCPSELLYSRHVNAYGIVMVVGGQLHIHLKYML